MEVPRVHVQLEVQLQAYTTATATQGPSLTCNLHHSSQLNPLSEAWDRTHNLMVPSQIRFHCTTMGTPCKYFLDQHRIRHFGMEK